MTTSVRLYRTEDTFSDKHGDNPRVVEKWWRDDECDCSSVAEVYRALPAAEFTSLLASRDALAARLKVAVTLLEECGACLNGHMIGINCHGPSLPAEVAANLKTFLKEPA